VKLGSPVAAQTVAGARAAKEKDRSKAQKLAAIIRDIEHRGVMCAWLGQRIFKRRGDNQLYEVASWGDGRREGP
jgi:hypothetical protein